ncbi:hypothetical protein NBO_462g0002 [Nosema bombycis CQ1]|uniref:Uncharacterized protein n=1 Tax=Nosema bombycis (strain CQ1 / CVCC 102059) TaxID=578461 RepID=R0MHS3_NOSB1|nr:hypothetical protein NBO_462g0002 [Nosema bombycis CQ1]|eukprot:EOB12333.1 hypothetical protein NBO_462g0002 [Nosema bombycis CQ1]
MKHLKCAIILNIIYVLCETYTVSLNLSIFPKKLIEFNDLSLGKINFITRKRQFFIMKHSKYFNNNDGELKLDGNRTLFNMDENFFGTQIKSKDLCLTAEPGNLVLKKCCSDDEFCVVRQSFLVTYFNTIEESDYEENENEDLVDIFETKHPGF